MILSFNYNLIISFCKLIQFCGLFVKDLRKIKCPKSFNVKIFASLTFSFFYHRKYVSKMQKKKNDLVK